jgi:hypothetical protein
MVVGQNQRAGERLCARQRCLEKIQLRVPQFLGRNDARVLEHVGIEGDDPHQRRLEGEEHAGLNLRGARETAGLGSDLELGGAKILQVRGKRHGRGSRGDHAVVI